MDRTISRRGLMRIAAGATLATSALPYIAGTSLAHAQAGDTQLVCNANNVNVRREPGLSTTVVGQLFSGDIVNVIGNPVEADGYTWLNITGYSRNVGPGWAAADFFGPPSGGGWNIGTHVYVAVDSLNLRDYPSLSGGVIMTLGRNAHLITSRAAVARDGYTWYGVVPVNGTEGYVAGDFLSTSPTGGNNGDGWPAGTSVRVAADGLRLRSGPGTDYGVVASYRRGADGQVLEGPRHGASHQWYKVEMYTDGNVGWFAADFLEIARYEPTGSRLRVVDGPLNLRASGSLGAPVITTIPTGGVVVIADASSVVNDGYHWWFVELEAEPGVYGWIAHGFTEEIS
ncbi:MAG TPA: SH3 domain-containing protein [Thermomicrobiales bacterium]|nr:SH3 domain-containing protein [Thermomicrobiales bacterium]